MVNEHHSQIRLWTIQPIEWYEQLLKDSIIYGNPKLSKCYNAKDINFKIAYDWLIVEMEKRAIYRPIPNVLPIWAWYQYRNTNKRRPDLRKSGYLPKGQKGVRIEFIKPKNKVLLSDFDLWHLILMYAYISDNESDDNAFDELLKSYNIDYLDKENYPPLVKQMIVDSWQKVLDMNYCSEYSAHPFENKSIQATVWSLSVNEIVKVEEFIAR